MAFMPDMHDRGDGDGVERKDDRDRQPVGRAALLVTAGRAEGDGRGLVHARGG
jgi:hypothetical protein